MILSTAIAKEMEKKADTFLAMKAKQEKLAKQLDSIKAGASKEIIGKLFEKTLAQKIEKFGPELGTKFAENNPDPNPDEAILALQEGIAKERAAAFPSLPSPAYLAFDAVAKLPAAEQVSYHQAHAAWYANELQRAGQTPYKQPLGLDTMPAEKAAALWEHQAAKLGAQWRDFKYPESQSKQPKQHWYCVEFHWKSKSEKTEILTAWRAYYTSEILACGGTPEREPEMRTVHDSLQAHVRGLSAQLHELQFPGAKAEKQRLERESYARAQAAIPPLPAKQAGAHDFSQSRGASNGGSAGGNSPRERLRSVFSVEQKTQ